MKLGVRDRDKVLVRAYETELVIPGQRRDCPVLCVNGVV